MHPTDGQFSFWFYFKIHSRLIPFKGSRESDKETLYPTWKQHTTRNKKNRYKRSNHFITFSTISYKFQIHSVYFTISHLYTSHFGLCTFNVYTYDTLRYVKYRYSCQYSLQYVMVRSILNLFNLWTNASTFIVHTRLCSFPPLFPRPYLASFLSPGKRISRVRI